MIQLQKNVLLNIAGRRLTWCLASCSGAVRGFINSAGKVFSLFLARLQEKGVGEYCGLKVHLVPGLLQ